MSDRKAKAPSSSSAYGAAPAGDTDFRKTWNRDEYAAKAAAREAKIKEEGKARYEAKLEGKKYVPRASTPPDAKETQSRAERLNVSANIGKTMLVPAGAGVGKRGRGAGFYCQDCDLTFKDNLQFVDHLNSRQHLVNTGQSGEVRKATLEDVKDRLAWLKRKREEEKKDEVIDLKARLETRQEQDEREREVRRQKRRERRRKTTDGSGIKQEEHEGNGIIC